MFSYLCEYQTSQNKIYLWKKQTSKKINKYAAFIFMYLTT